MAEVVDYDLSCDSVNSEQHWYNSSFAIASRYHQLYFRFYCSKIYLAFSFAIANILVDLGEVYLCQRYAHDF